MNSLLNFAAEDGPHISLKAEPVFEIGSYTLTNSQLYGALISITIIAIFVAASKKIGIKPITGFFALVEMLVEFIIDMLESIFQSKAQAHKYAPIFGTFFFFIVFTNLLGLLPLVGSGLTVGEGTLFRPFTADLNGTLAISLVAIVTVQYLAIKESGLLGHLSHYFTDKPWNPINFFIGILEVFSEFIRVISLALRLFLNTFIGEALIAIFLFIGQYGGFASVLPIVLFELLVAFIQAYIFTVLTATYLALAIAHSHDHGDEHEDRNHPANSQLSPSEAT